MGARRDPRVWVSRSFGLGSFLAMQEERDDNPAIVPPRVFIGEASFAHGNWCCPTRRVPSRVNCTGKFDMNFRVSGKLGILLDCGGQGGKEGGRRGEGRGICG